MRRRGVAISIVASPQPPQNPPAGGARARRVVGGGAAERSPRHLRRQQPFVGSGHEMPRKEIRARISPSNSIRGAVASGGGPRRSPRLHSAAGNRCVAGHSLAVAAAAHLRRSPRFLSAEEGHAGGVSSVRVAATPRGRPRRGISPGKDRASRLPATPRRKSLRNLSSQGGDRRDATRVPVPRERKDKNQRQASSFASSQLRSPEAKISERKRSLRSSKTAVYPDEGVITGGCNREGNCRRRSTRLRTSVENDRTGEIERRNGQVDIRRNLGQERIMKKTVTCALLAVNATKRLGRPAEAQFKNAIPQESAGTVKIKKKRKNPVLSETYGLREKKREVTEAREDSDPQGKRGESDCGCSEWTSDQEDALHEAYILAKPSLHFWKKIAKMVPGKSAQECFDRMHSKIPTPAPIQPRPRAKAIDCSPLELGDLFKARRKRAKSCRNKSVFAHKTVRHILKKHSVVDQSQEADLFSVLETSPSTNVGFSHIRTPISEDVKESPGLVQWSGENNSSGHKRAFSRFTSIPTNYQSPEVLKPVKNIAMHEKYIDQLHCREARRRMYDKAANTTSSVDDKENIVPKGTVVKSAKNALVSEAREIICQFVDAQSTFPSNSEETDGSGDGYEDNP